MNTEQRDNLKYIFFINTFFVFRNAKRLLDCSPTAAAAPGPFAAVLPPPPAPLPLPRLLLHLRAPVQARQGNVHLSQTLAKEEELENKLLSRGYIWLSDMYLLQNRNWCVKQAVWIFGLSGELITQRWQEHGGWQQW